MSIKNIVGLQQAMRNLREKGEAIYQPPPPPSPPKRKSYTVRELPMMEEIASELKDKRIKAELFKGLQERLALVEPPPPPPPMPQRSSKTARKPATPKHRGLSSVLVAEILSSTKSKPVAVAKRLPDISAYWGSQELADQRELAYQQDLARLRLELEEQEEPEFEIEEEVAPSSAALPSRVVESAMAFYDFENEFEDLFEAELVTDEELQSMWQPKPAVQSEPRAIFLADWLSEMSSGYVEDEEKSSSSMHRDTNTEEEPTVAESSPWSWEPEVQTLNDRILDGHHLNSVLAATLSPIPTGSPGTYGAIPTGNPGHVSLIPETQEEVSPIPDRVTGNPAGAIPTQPSLHEKIEEGWTAAAVSVAEGIQSLISARVPEPAPMVAVLQPDVDTYHGLNDLRAYKQQLLPEDVVVEPLAQSEPLAQLEPLMQGVVTDQQEEYVPSINEMIQMGYHIDAVNVATGLSDYQASVTPVPVERPTPQQPIKKDPVFIAEWLAEHNAPVPVEELVVPELPDVELQHVEYVPSMFDKILSGEHASSVLTAEALKEITKPEPVIEEILPVSPPSVVEKIDAGWTADAVKVAEGLRDVQAWFTPTEEADELPSTPTGETTVEEPVLSLWDRIQAGDHVSSVTAFELLNTAAPEPEPVIEKPEEYVYVPTMVDKIYAGEHASAVITNETLAQLLKPVVAPPAQSEEEPVELPEAEEYRPSMLDRIYAGEHASSVLSATGTQDLRDSRVTVQPETPVESAPPVAAAEPERLVALAEGLEGLAGYKQDILDRQAADIRQELQAEELRKRERLIDTYELNRSIEKTPPEAEISAFEEETYATLPVEEIAPSEPSQDELTPLEPEAATPVASATLETLNDVISFNIPELDPLQFYKTTIEGDTPQ